MSSSISNIVIKEEAPKAIKKANKQLSKKTVKCYVCKCSGGNLREVEDQQECYIICRQCWVEATDNGEPLHNCGDDWTDDEEEQ